MPSNPPTVADLDAEVTGRCGLVLHDAGLFLRALDSAMQAVTPVVRQGLRKGFKCVGYTPSDPLILADADILNLSTFALERVVDEAELFSLQQCRLGWWRVTQRHQEPLSSAVTSSGWLIDELRGVKDRISELKAMCEKPYLEPTDQIVVAPGRPRFGYGFVHRSFPDPACFDGFGPWGGFFP